MVGILQIEAVGALTTSGCIRTFPRFKPLCFKQKIPVQKITLSPARFLKHLAVTLSVALFCLPSSQAGDTFKWTVQYMVDNSQACFGQSQKIWPRHNRGMALSTDGKYLYLGYHHGANGVGEVRKVAIGIPDDYTRATSRVLHGPLAKAIACDDKGRVYIANAGEILIYDSELQRLEHKIAISICEGVAVTREGKELVLYATDRQLGELQRFVLEEKGGEVTGDTPVGLKEGGKLVINGSLSLRNCKVDPKGNIWIADHDGARVFRISPNGQKIESADVRSPMDMAFDGNRAYVSCGEERVVAVMETDSMKLLGNLAVPWDELELSPKGNNNQGALCGIIAVPGKGFFVTNEGGQTANQHSTYGRADENTDFVLGKLYRDAYLDDNEPVLRALEVSGP